MKKLLYVVLTILILLPYAGMGGLYFWYKQSLDDIENASFIIISKEDMTLRLIDFKGKVQEQYPIACGQKYGNKEKKGDYKTPEGVFRISEIVNSESWSHDFGDGKGTIHGAYGPFFMRLETPGHKGIGIHGTHKPESIGTRDTEGCIRLHNEDIKKLREKCHPGMTVVITTSYLDVVKGDTSLIETKPATPVKAEEEVKEEKEIKEEKQPADTVKTEEKKEEVIVQQGNRKEPIRVEKYIVKSGDSLSGIAAKYPKGTNISTISEHNPNIDPEKLQPGMEIKIPIYE